MALQSIIRCSRCGEVKRAAKGRRISSMCDSCNRVVSGASLRRPKGQLTTGAVLSAIIAVVLTCAGAAYAITALGFGCHIKGNISYNTGERIYHMPGDEFYGPTIIDPLKGERWFCSEADAQAAGWRRAWR